MKKGDIVTLNQDGNEGRSDYIRAQQAGYLCVVNAVREDGIAVMVPSKQEGSSDTDILYSKSMNVKPENVALAEEKYENMRIKT